MQVGRFEDGSGERTAEAGARIRVAILAEIRFYREGLAQFLGVQPGMEVVGTAEDGQAALALARRLDLDVFLVDMASSGSLEVIRMLRERQQRASVVALGVREDEREVIPPAEAGVSSYVSRNASLDELCLAVERAARGEAACSPRIAAILVHRLATLAAELLPERAEIPLTRRQLEIVRLIEEGLPNKAIAQRLYIEVPTVKNHVHNILERLGVQGREEAAAAVRRLSAGLSLTTGGRPGGQGAL